MIPYDWQQEGDFRGEESADLAEQLSGQRIEYSEKADKVDKLNQHITREQEYDKELREKQDNLTGEQDRP